jgi:hypothetical protein
VDLERGECVVAMNVNVNVNILGLWGYCAENTCCPLGSVGLNIVESLKFGGYPNLSKSQLCGFKMSEVSNISRSGMIRG